MESNGKKGPDPLDLETLKREGHQNLFEQVKISVGERTVYAATDETTSFDHKKARSSRSWLGKDECTPQMGRGHQHLSDHKLMHNGGHFVRALVELNQESVKTP